MHAGLLTVNPSGVCTTRKYGFVLDVRLSLVARKHRAIVGAFTNNQQDSEKELLVIRPTMAELAGNAGGKAHWAKGCTHKCSKDVPAETLWVEFGLRPWPGVPSERFVWGYCIKRPDRTNGKPALYYL